MNQELQRNKSLILDVLQTAGRQLYGYEIRSAVRDNHNTDILLASLYTAISKLLDDRLIEKCDPPHNASDDDASRQYYKPTKRGYRKRIALPEKASFFQKLFG